MIMNNIELTTEQNISSLIYFIRGEKVMLDLDLAQLYGVETRVLRRSESEEGVSGRKGDGDKETARLHDRKTARQKS